MLAFGKASLQQKIVLCASRVPWLGVHAIATGMRRKINPRAVTTAKVKNFMLAQRESVARAVRVRSLPYMINIDTMNGCNLACPFCPTGTRQLSRKRGRLSLDQVRKVIDACKDHALAVRFYNWGEPFLNPDIFDMIRYASEAGIHTTVSSNMSIRVDNLAEKILDSGLDNIHVSIDGLEQETLERYRRKADIDLVFENIRRLVALKKERGSRRPNLELVFLVFRHNEHELPRLQQVRKELGADSFEPSQAFIYHESFVPRDPRYQPAQKIFAHSCHYLYSELTVEADGHVSPCCTNSDERWDVGTIEDLADLRRFWNGPRFLAMRARNAGREPEEYGVGHLETLCDHCDFIGEAGCEAGKLSPLPPAFVAKGATFEHGLDEMPAVMRS